jgi:hypothetical protein
MSREGTQSAHNTHHNHRTTCHTICCASSYLLEGTRRCWLEAEPLPVTLLPQPLLAQPLTAQPLLHASRLPDAEGIPLFAAAAADPAHVLARSTHPLVWCHLARSPPIDACAGHEASPAHSHIASLSDVQGNLRVLLAVVTAAVVTATTVMD